MILFNKIGKIKKLYILLFNITYCYICVFIKNKRMENILELLLKEIKDLNLKVDSLIKEKEKPNTRTIETSTRFEEYKDFMDCFKEGEKFLTVGELISEFETNFGASAIGNKLAGRIFSHFVKDKKMYKVINGGQKIYKLTTI